MSHLLHISLPSCSAPCDRPSPPQPGTYTQAENRLSPAPAPAPTLTPARCHTSRALWPRALCVRRWKRCENQSPDSPYKSILSWLKRSLHEIQDRGGNTSKDNLHTDITAVFLPPVHKTALQSIIKTGLLSCRSSVSPTHTQSQYHSLQYSHNWPVPAFSSLMKTVADHFMFFHSLLFTSLF